jgi:hypothetical protein
MNNEKRVYTLEDNVKYIAFNLKDIAKHLEALDSSLGMMNASILQLKEVIEEKKVGEKTRSF